MAAGNCLYVVIVSLLDVYTRGKKRFVKRVTKGFIAVQGPFNAMECDLVLGRRKRKKGGFIDKFLLNTTVYIEYQ